MANFPIVYLVKNILTGQTEHTARTLTDAREYGWRAAENYREGNRSDCDLAIVQAQIVEFVEKGV